MGMSEQRPERHVRRIKKDIFIGSNPTTGRPYFKRVTEEIPVEKGPTQVKPKTDEERVNAWQDAVSPEDASDERMRGIIQNQNPPKPEEK